jgi:hypothetical protein
VSKPSEISPHWKVAIANCVAADGFAPPLTTTCAAQAEANVVPVAHTAGEPEVVKLDSPEKADLHAALGPIDCMTK